MPILYRGAGPGTYWHTTQNARELGFHAHMPGQDDNADIMMQHILGHTYRTPYVSLTVSFGIARSYALVGTSGVATSANSGYVYLLNIPDDLPLDFVLYDPIKEIANVIPAPPQQVPYQHKGTKDFLHGVLDPGNYGQFLTEISESPDGQVAGRILPSDILRCLTSAVRDAELLAVGVILRRFVIDRIDVYQQF